MLPTNCLKIEPEVTLPIPLSASWQKWGKVGIKDSPLLPPHPRSLSPRPASMQCSFFSTIININLERSPPPSPFATIARSNQTQTIAVRRTKAQLGEHNHFQIDNSKLGSTQQQKICWHWHVARIISSQKIYGLYGLKHHIVEMRGDVTDAGQTNKQWR